MRSPYRKCDLRTEVLGAELSFPAILAPIGYSRLIHPAGEVAASRGAGAAGTAYILSTIAGHKLEDVRAASTGPVWYQLYLVGGRPAAEAALERACACGLLRAVRHDRYWHVRDARARHPKRHRPAHGRKLDRNDSVSLAIFLRGPRGLPSYLMDGGLHKLPNVIVPGQGPMALIDVAEALANSVVTWQDFRWLREVWPGPIVAKGVLTGEDARRAIDVGAAGVVVSNHGGRQLDGVSATLRVLPEIVKAVNGQVEVLMDGGVRRGGDIIKALCMGARAVLVGPRLRLRTGRGRSARRHQSHRNPARRPGTHDETAGLRVYQRTGPIVRGLPRDWPTVMLTR